MSGKNFKNTISSLDETLFVDKNLQEVPVARDASTIILYIALIRPEDNLCNLSNQLIIDCTGPTYTFSSSGICELNGSPYNVFQGIEGLLTTINAVNSGMVLKIFLESGSGADCGDECINTPYGFKLSTLLENIGDISLITPTSLLNYGDKTLRNDIWDNVAHLIMNQRAFKVIKNCRKYTIFNFVIKNVGEIIAQKVLFKDVIPQGGILCKHSIFVKYKGFDIQRITSDNYEIKGRMLYLKLNNIELNGEVNITFVCTINSCDCVKPSVNIGVLTYVGYHEFEEIENNPVTESTTVLIQQISNPKPLIN